MEDWTIAEEFTLPSKGKVYSQDVNPNIKIRSMTTEEEMKRLGHSPYIYKMFSNIIDDCLVEKPNISTYDMCIGDYQFLLYKLRSVTYGPDYEVATMCPHCGNTNTIKVNLDKLKTNSFEDSMKKYMEFELPVSKKLIKLKLQTPRMLDEVNRKTKELQEHSSDIDSEPAILFNVVSLIETIDGQVISEQKLENFVRKLPMKDTNFILQNSKKLIMGIGIDTTISHTCESCHNEFKFQLPITGEFFGPSID